MSPQLCREYFARALTLVFLTFAIWGCNEDETGRGQTTELPVKVPALVQNLMDAEFPVDGEVHVESRGKITITPDTPVCEMWIAAPEQARAGHLFGVNSDDLFKPLGQSPGRRNGGGDRQRSVLESICNEPDAVIIYGRKTENRRKRPYKLVLAIWQGDPADGGPVWRGSIERLHGRRDDIQLPAISDGILADPDETLRIQNESINLDISRLTDHFIVYVGVT